jgi:tetratricopeptide (TPR) repeat protein
VNFFRLTIILPAVFLLFSCAPKAREIQVATGLNDSLSLRGVGVNTRIAELTAQAAKTPDDASIRLELARVQEAKRNLFAAAEEARETLKLKPNSADALVILGRASFDSERFVEAKEHFISALSINPSLATAHAGLADCLMVEKNYADAESEYSEALRIAPDATAVLFNRAAALARLKRWPGAEADFLKVLSIDPANIPSWLNLGIVYEKSGKPAKAVEAWESALKLDPSRTEIQGWIDDVRNRP